ncbi:glycosyltransferase family 4 protein [Aquirhabdus parva]|uniref:Glycosyltransferase family 1 protein n=1 Tax=Aquirhabdus parva TaxID=2283318 RepID=A0A345P3W4_9GAMM|nr:glycosyltransferase family 1 protein [Aquirhabdus parva]AXI01973.1 glycosyltransferase family 1 protein [Aquirhabdus parva]
MNLIIAVDALKPPLTGIGRYTKELVSRIRVSEDIHQLKYYLNARWVEEPLTIPVTGLVKYESLKVPRVLRQFYLGKTVKNSVFHSPNFFIPPFVEHGIATIHDLSVFKFPETHPAERVRDFERRLGQTLSVAKHIITDSKSTREEVIEYFGWPSARISAIHLGVPEVYKPRPHVDIYAQLLSRYNLTPNKFTLCVSTIEPRKKVDRLIQAYALLPIRIRTEYPLVIIGGKGWHSELLHKVMEDAQRAGWLYYLGFVDEVYLPAIYAGARLFVYPSIYEGFGLPIAEAMACGIPVIASNRSCLPEVTSGAAKLINPDDVDEFSLSLQACLTDLIWREKAVGQGLNVAKAYTWDNCAQQTLKVYKRVANAI